MSTIRPTLAFCYRALGAFQPTCPKSWLDGLGKKSRTYGFGLTKKTTVVLAKNPGFENPKVWNDEIVIPHFLALKTWVFEILKYLDVLKFIVLSFKYLINLNITFII